MIKEIPVLSEEMEKLLNRTYSDLMNILVNLSGNLTDIASGTRIRIPMAAGYVNFYKSLESYEITLFLKETMMEQLPQKANPADDMDNHKYI